MELSIKDYVASSDYYRSEENTDLKKFAVGKIKKRLCLSNIVKFDNIFGINKYTRVSQNVMNLYVETTFFKKIFIKIFLSKKFVKLNLKNITGEKGFIYLNIIVI